MGMSALHLNIAPKPKDKLIVPLKSVDDEVGNPTLDDHDRLRNIQI